MEFRDPVADLAQNLSLPWQEGERWEGLGTLPVSLATEGATVWEAACGEAKRWPSAEPSRTLVGLGEDPTSGWPASQGCSEAKVEADGRPLEEGLGVNAILPFGAPSVASGLWSRLPGAAKTASPPPPNERRWGVSCSPLSLRLLRLSAEPPQSVRLHVLLP